VHMYLARVDNNTKLVLMLEIFQQDGEKFYKVGYSNPFGV